jgi:hypothetical protein
MGTLNLDGLKGYINANKDVIVSKIVALADSTKYLQVQNGVTTDTTIHGLITNLEVQDGKDCGFTAAGTQSVTERELKPAFLKVNHEYCPKDFLNTYKHYETQVAMGKSALPLEEALVADVLKAVGNKNEQLIWSGDKASGDMIDGLTTLIKADSGVNKQTVEGTVYDKVKALYKKVTDKRMVAVMSAAKYRELVMELVEKNLFHYNTQEGNEMVLTLPGTNFKVYGIDGIKAEDTNIYGLIWEETFVGMDNADDAAMFDLFWSDDDRVYKLVIEWALAVNYMFSESIIVIQ